jgi:hypothetical protein
MLAISIALNRRGLDLIYQKRLQLLTLVNCNFTLTGARGYSLNSERNARLDEEKRTRWDVQPELAIIQSVPLTAYKNYKVKELETLSAPPRSSIVSSYDFIFNSLYHPSYGYFSRNAEILELKNPFDFHKVRDSNELMNTLSEVYAEKEVLSDNIKEPRQLWHTPSEVFRPWYGKAFAQYIAQHPTCKSSQALHILEIGSGNGTLMRDLLDELQNCYPTVYERVQCTVVEISNALASRQKQTLQYHLSKINHVSGSALDSIPSINEPCFVLALEVADNLPHDVIRWDLVSGLPLRGMVTCDEWNEYEEVFVPIEPDKYVDHARLARCIFLQSLKPNDLISNASLRLPKMARQALQHLPGAPNLSKTTFVPTGLLQLFEHLVAQIPKHHLILGDFNSLPNAICGTNSPVVQTRYSQTMVPVSTYLVKPGYFDIFFPTDFRALSEMYSMVRNNDYDTELCTQTASQWSARNRKSTVGAPSTYKVVNHSSFLEEYAEINQTATISGENAMLLFYQNCSIFLS